MSESITLRLPADLVRQARAVAAASNRRLDDLMTAYRAGLVRKAQAVREAAPAA